MRMIENVAHFGTNAYNKIIETQEQYIDRICSDLAIRAKEKLRRLINSGKINDDIDLNDITWDYEIAKTTVMIAIKDVNKKWHTNCHFNAKCKRYEDIIKGEK